MSLIVLFALIIIALTALILKKNRWSFISLSLSLFLCLSVGSGFIPNFLLAGLQIYSPLRNPEWKENNVIILLGTGDNFIYARMHEAARLYFECKSHTSRCSILATGGDPRNRGTAEADIMFSALKDIGIKAQDILTETQSNNTFQNALFSSELIRKAAFDRIILVTSGTHMRRALMLFSRSGLDPMPAPADHLSVNSSWKYLYYNFFLTDLSLHEYVGQLRYRISE